MGLLARFRYLVYACLSSKAWFHFSIFNNADEREFTQAPTQEICMRGAISGVGVLDKTAT